MRATIRDRRVLESLQPGQVAAYLRATGWESTEVQLGRSSLWVRKDATTGREVVVELPLSTTLRDYALRMGELLRTLESVEDRSQIEIIKDLLVADADVIRIHIQSDQQGSISLEAGTRAVERVREMLLAAACAAIEPRPYYHTRKPQEAVEYLRTARLGQTEEGSYTVTVLSPVPPALRQPSLFPEAEEDAASTDDPYPRKVVRTLARALAEVRAAAERAMISREFVFFQEAVKYGVSADLCEAVASVSDSDHLRPIDVMFSWSPARPVSPGTPSRIVFEQTFFSVIAEAARLFRERSPMEDFEVRGFVVGLNRAPEARIGTVTVGTFVEGKPRKVHFQLPEPYYTDAVRAHQNREPIVCYGELFKSGNVYELQNVRGFQVDRQSNE